MTRGFSKIMNQEIIKEFRWHGHSYVFDEEDQVYYSRETDAKYPVLMDVPGDAY